jgi:biopolymer transport protein ExbD
MRRHRDAVLIRNTSMIPYVGVLLTLLIIYMVITPGYPHHGVNAELPKALHGREFILREDAMLITIERDGKVYMNTEQVTADQFAARINAATKISSDPRLFIKADARARYKMVKDVLVQVPFGLAPRITFIVDQPAR